MEAPISIHSTIVGWVIAWDKDASSATDWHVYVRKGFGGTQFLGRTASGDQLQFNWSGDSEDQTSKVFQSGPDFNSAYSFRVVRIDAQLSPDDYINQKGIVGFNLEGANDVALTIPELPNIPAETIGVYDDILGGDNLAPPLTIGADEDSVISRALQIVWNFGVNSDEVMDYHVFVSVNEQDFVFLGQTNTGTLNYFWWTPNNEFRTIDEFQGGPEGGNSYQFKVYMLPIDGQSKSMTTGVINYTVVE
jgi:hypothetical protein